MADLNEGKFYEMNLFLCGMVYFYENLKCYLFS